MQIMLALGISSSCRSSSSSGAGVVTPAGLHRVRRYSVVLAFLAGAILSPGADILSMFMMTLPLLVLYEVGVAGTVIIHRRRMRRAAASVAVVLMLLAGGAGRANAQVPQKPRVPDSRRRQPGPIPRGRRRIHWPGAAAGQSGHSHGPPLGLPTGPTCNSPRPIRSWTPCCADPAIR
jgi:hypothetical protein